jgi:hypothetical protein
MSGFLMSDASPTRPGLALHLQADRRKSWGDARRQAWPLFLQPRPDSFCSPKNEQGAGFLAFPPIKIGLLSQSAHDGNCATTLLSAILPDDRLIRSIVGGSAAPIVVIEPFGRHSYLSEKVMT